MVWVPKSPPEGYIHLKLNKGVYSPKTLDGEGVGSEDPAKENVPFNFPGKICFLLWMEHRKGLEDSLVGGFSPTHLKIFPQIGMKIKTVSNHQMFFLFNDTRTKEASPRIEDSDTPKMSGWEREGLIVKFGSGSKKNILGSTSHSVNPFHLIFRLYCIVSKRINKHSNGKSQSWIGNNYIFKWWISIAMFHYQSVSLFHGL